MQKQAQASLGVGSLPRLAEVEQAIKVAELRRPLQPLAPGHVTTACQGAAEQGHRSRVTDLGGALPPMSCFAKDVHPGRAFPPAGEVLHLRVCFGRLVSHSQTPEVDAPAGAQAAQHDAQVHPGQGIAPTRTPSQRRDLGKVGPHARMVGPNSRPVLSGQAVLDRGSTSLALASMPTGRPGSCKRRGLYRATCRAPREGR